MKKRFFLILAWLAYVTFTLIGTAFAASTTLSNAVPLPVEKAFVFSASVYPPGQIHVHWNVAPGYYLYKQRMKFSVEPDLPTHVLLPRAEFKTTSAQATDEVYSGHVVVPITLLQSQMKPEWKVGRQQVQLNVDYQGCSLHGFCYPPVHQSLNVSLAFGAVTEVGPSVSAPFSSSSASSPASSSHGIQSLLTNQNEVRSLFDAQNGYMIVLIFFGLGLLLTFTPCVLPMVPILTSIIIGHKQPISTQKALFLSSTYVLGSAITFGAAGVLAAIMGSSLQVWLQQPWIIALVSALFVLLALALFGVYDLRLPGHWQSRITGVSRQQEGGTYLGVFIMGVISTLIVSPCVTAPLVGAFLYIAQTGNLLLGGSALFAMGLGMGLPLIAMGASAGKWLPRKGPWLLLIQKLFGVLMLGMALWLLARVFSISVIVQCAGVLLMVIALYLAIVRRGANRAKKWLMGELGILGAVLIVLASTPLVSVTLQNIKQGTEERPSFILVRNVDDLKLQLSLAQDLGKPVLLDFYADWCESCVSMDKNVFSLPDVRKRLSHFLVLRADLTANTAEDAALLKNYQVIAPPAILFFNDQGQEVGAHRIMGELNAEEFLTRINTFITASCDKKVTC